MLLFPWPRVLWVTPDARGYVWLTFNTLLSRTPVRAAPQPVSSLYITGRDYSLPVAEFCICSCWFSLSSQWSITVANLESSEWTLCPWALSVAFLSLLSLNKQNRCVFCVLHSAEKDIKLSRPQDRNGTRQNETQQLQAIWFNFDISLAMRRKLDQVSRNSPNLNDSMILKQKKRSK